jgi:tetraacyldisaccharide 4'-kinase
LRIEVAWEAFCARRGLLWGLTLYPLSVLYGFISRLLRLGEPEPVEGLRVISVGNLGMGGAGKSPLVIAIAQILKAKTAVLTRGYGADEAAMLAEALPGREIIVDPRRLRGARLALKRGCKAAILDDGFQRRHELARDLDILVWDWQRAAVEAHCLPAGRLREPLEAAAEADAVVVTHAPEGWNREALRAALPLPYQGLRVFRGDHVPTGLRHLRSGARKPLGWLRGKRVTAMSGIGRPGAFEESLRRLGAEAIPLRFGDHHAYKPSDLPQGALVVTTAKDGVKLGLAGAWVLEMRLQVTPSREFEALLKP